jgi:hypothetical protein
MLPGTLGQSLLLGRSLFSHSRNIVPFGLIFVFLFAPGLLVWGISFCRVAPCGPKRFVQLLTIGMAWYSFNTLACELVWLIIPASHPHTYSAAIPHLLCYGSALSFIVLIRAARDARNYHATQPESV